MNIKKLIGIAEAWHGGQDSGLYSLLSTGKLWDKEHVSRCWSELHRARLAVQRKPSDYDVGEADELNDAMNYLAYLEENFPDQSVDEFTEAYITCALWSSHDESDPETGGDPMDDNYGPEDIAPETMVKMQQDCQDFLTENQALILEHGTLSRAGHDFWLTRNGHGAGFWDGDWPEDVGETLTKASKTFGEFDLYVGDDGKIHAM